MANLRKEVNTELEKNNGTSYLNIAYEEVLFPVVFTGKKKYYGLEHKKEPNFNLGELFIKGVDIVKRSQSKLFRDVGIDVGKEIMNRTLKVDNGETIHQIVEKVLWENVEKLSKLDYDEFIQTLLGEMVKISMKIMANLRKEVNTELEKNNGTSYLNIAYEEVLFPVVFTGKKKYYGLEHKKEPNFNLGELFIKGVDIVKRSQSKLFRDVGIDVGKEIMNRTLKVDNGETIHQIVEKVLWENVEKLSKLDYDEFIQTCIWRPKKEVLENQQLIKKGLPVNEYLYKVPKSDKRFSYIVVKKGDCMEYPDVVKKFNKKINIDYYTESLFALCVHFINYDNKYQPSPESLAKALDCKKKSKEKKSQNVKGLLQSNVSLSLDENEIANIKDVESQKLTKKWFKNYIKNLCDAPKKDETIISHLWKDATTHAEKIYLTLVKLT
ncbi:hypothetical protein Glove_199g122 [Diversispora epigaea]|uniref:DNA-directed DNA polymerase n=1 Tax=Diversispora epigaea TaxID=1348612 RepID=A0A397ITI0_9GLOM|nr:hypothetical protein Glove_199g122 [Diversispora epigaea]